MFTGFILIHAAERKAQVIKLIRGRGEEEIGLVLGVINPAEQRGPAILHITADIMAGGEALRPEVTRRCQQIGEFHRLVTAHTRDRGFATQVAIGEIIHHLLLKTAFVIEDKMANAESSCNHPSIMNIGTGAARPLGADRLPMVIELERNADNVITLLLEQGGGYRAVDPARHGHHHAGILRRSIKAEGVQPLRMICACGHGVLPLLI